MTIDPDRLRQLHDAGLKSRQIAARLGVSQTTVSRHLRALGLATRAVWAKKPPLGQERSSPAPPASPKPTSSGPAQPPDPEPGPTPARLAIDRAHRRARRRVALKLASQPNRQPLAWLADLLPAGTLGHGADVDAYGHNPKQEPTP